MNRNQRTVSALMRHLWAIEPTWAQAHIPLVDAFLTGKMAGMNLADDDDANRPIGFVLDQTNARVGLLSDEDDEKDAWQERPFANPNLPDGSVAILDIRGAIMKEGYCWSYGTEDYAKALEDVYANPKLIGAVLLVDSPGGQLSGTPTLFDQVIRPEKPVVGRVHDGMAGSAAYWILSACSHIYASQATDQIGSIGVFVRLRDYSKYNANAGIEEINVYARLSKDKNKPFNDALEGKPALLEDELDKAALLFRQAVERGRGDRLQIRKDAQGDDEPFTGKVYYAGEAIQLGLIDGYGSVADAVEKVRELSKKPAGGAVSSSRSAETITPAGILSTVAPPATDPSLTNSNSSTTPTNMALGIFHLSALQAVVGKAAGDITDAQLSALNEQLVEKSVTGITAVRDTDAGKVAQVAELQAQITTLQSEKAALETEKTTQATQITGLNTQITTLTKERDDARTEAASFGSQPGAVASRAQKVDEKLTEKQTDVVISETDALVLQMRANLQPKTAA